MESEGKTIENFYLYLLCLLLLQRFMVFDSPPITSNNANFKKTFIYFFIHLFGCAGSYLHHEGCSSLIRDLTWLPALGGQILSHWTTKAVPVITSLYLFKDCNPKRT